MKPIIPLPPAGPSPPQYNPLPDHTQLPDREGGKPLRPPPGPPPDHTMLPDKDGTFVRNSYEFWQSHLLTDSLLPVLGRIYPQGNYFIGEDCGIYWRLTTPPERGAKAPDWFLVTEVPRLLDGQMRRSYVMWQEGASPLLVLEYVSGDGAEERDRSPPEGKFWVYENAIHAAFYGIFEPNTARLEMQAIQAPGYVQREPNAQGRYPITPLGVELGTWHGTFAGYELTWLRWWTPEGQLLLTGAERAAEEHQRAERLAERLRALGENPDAV